MKKKLSISLLPGDGIGQEISIEAKKILNWIDQNTELELDCFEELVGGASIDKHQTPLHDKTLEKIKRIRCNNTWCRRGAQMGKTAF